VLLVIDSGAQKADWSTIFAGASLPSGRGVRVVQAAWGDIFVSAQSRGNHRALVHVRVEGRMVTVQPDMCLIRNEVRGAEPGQDYRNTLFGLMYANLPSVNSLHSVYMFLERPVIQAELNATHTRLGADFPIVEQQFFGSHKEMMYSSAFPAVVKVGHAHAGFGKMRIHHHHDFEDFRSLMAVGGNYCSAEPFIDGEYDIRVQKIGAHYRAFKRISMSDSWKTNTGTSQIETLEVTEQYKRWADEASRMFGGLDICTVDAIHDSASNNELIMEVNGTSSGLNPQMAEEDNGHIREVVLQRMAHL